MTYHKIFYSKKLSSKDFRALSAPNLKGQPLFLDLKWKLVSIQTHFVQQVFRNSVPFWRYLERVVLGADPVTPFRDRITKKLLLQIDKLNILSIFCSILLIKMFLHLEILSIKVYDFWPLKNPNYVTHDKIIIIYYVNLKIRSIQS